VKDYSVRFKCTNEARDPNVPLANWVTDMKAHRTNFRHQVSNFSNLVVHAIGYAEFIVFPHFPLAYLIYIYIPDLPLPILMSSRVSTIFWDHLP